MRIEGQRLLLEGAIDVEHHREMREASAACLAGGDVTADFRAVTALDSSALALVLHWQRELAARGHHLILEAVPASLLALADLYGVRALLDAR